MKMVADELFRGVNVDDFEATLSLELPK